MTTPKNVNMVHILIERKTPYRAAVPALVLFKATHRLRNFKKRKNGITNTGVKFL